MKFALMESTVDWIEGSKNPDTCALRIGGDVSENRRKGGSDQWITLLTSTFPP